MVKKVSRGVSSTNEGVISGDEENNEKSEDWWNQAYHDTDNLNSESDKVHHSEEVITSDLPEG